MKLQTSRVIALVCVIGLLCSFGAAYIRQDGIAAAQAETLGRSGGDAVTQSQMSSAISTVMSAIPVPAATVPPGPSGPGVVGSGNTYVPANAAQKQTVQRTTVVTDASGNWSVTWGVSFVSSTPTVIPIPLNPTGSSPYVCNVLTRSATAATGKCWQVGSQAVALISLTIALAPASAPTSTSVMLIAAEPTQ